MSEFKFYTDYPDTTVPDNSENANANTMAIIKLFGLDKNPFSETKTYAVNDFVTKDYILYKCHTPVTTTGPWTGTENWNEASLLISNE